jgi:monofunctional biosynthetic peptidoglycan transglycosylase
VKRILLIVLAALLLWLAWEWFTFPDVKALKAKPPKTTAFMELRKKQLRAQGKSDAIEYKWVPYSRISSNLRRAVLVAEDNAFYEHKGADVEAMKEAFQRNWKRGKLTHGGSTITQQLAKNLYLSPSRNPLRKLKEYLIARALEKHLTKKRILEIYLNVVEMGERVYGAEAAARHYFHKSARSLSPSQAALLAGCLPNPRLMNPGSPNKRLRWRQNMILSRMRRWGHVFENEVLKEKKPQAPDPAPLPAETVEPTDTAETTDTTDTTVTTDTTQPEPPDEEPPVTETVSTSAPPTETTATIPP